MGECEISRALYRLVPLSRDMALTRKSCQRRAVAPFVRRACVGEVVGAVLKPAGQANLADENLFTHLFRVSHKADLSHTAGLSSGHDLGDNFIARRFICTKL